MRTLNEIPMWERPIVGEKGKRFIQFRQRRPENRMQESFICDLAIFLSDHEIPFEPGFYYSKLKVPIIIPRHYDDLPAGVLVKTIKFAVLFKEPEAKFVNSKNPIKNHPFFTNHDLTPLFVWDLPSLHEAQQKIVAYFERFQSVSNTAAAKKEAARRARAAEREALIERECQRISAFDLDIDNMELDDPDLQLPAFPGLEDHPKKITRSSEESLPKLG